MIHKNLFDKVLIEPALKCPGGKLRIVSGYATASMVDMHMEKLIQQNKHKEMKVSIELVVGMAARGGLHEPQHLAFQKIEKEKPWGIDIQCRYVTCKHPPVHAKSYLWLDCHGKPVQAYCGSANYTLQGFASKQVETLTKTAPGSSKRFHDMIMESSISCNHHKINELVQILKDNYIKVGDATDTSPGKNQSEKLISVNLTLLNSRSDETPKRSGINWGQRPNRDHNQAYINIPSNIGKGEFFPERRQPFVVHTDDGEVFTCVRAQTRGKGIHTTYDNSILGSYLRNRLGLNSGEYVTRQHLDSYGRTDVTFYKIDLETYYLDFSV